ncbi:GNAT family N-acetyltransferase [Coleofasciculus chthonoplastes]|uniref:GNAT family N-acetyltransferase n=1 Tax=Coleofasciculus chthonoplastes TaxID=64178 RepID=UPI004063BAA0
MQQLTHLLNFMITLTMRPHRVEADLDAIALFLKTCEAVDLPNEYPSVSDILMQFDAPSVDQQRDICLWEDAEGQLIVLAGLMIPTVGETVDGFLWFRVHPTEPLDILYSDIIPWAESRMQEVRQERCLAVKLLAGAGAEQAKRITFLENCGFRIERYFLTMVRSLSEPIPEPQLPDGFTLRPIQGEPDAQTWVELFNDTFIDHWNYHPETVDAFNHKLKNPEFRPDLSVVAIAPDGTWAGFCDCYIPKDGNQGWINPVGTRRGYRKQGVARSMLQAVMQQLKVEGMETAMLYVDAENPSGARRLYESVGFQTTHTQIAYVKDMAG